MSTDIPVGAELGRLLDAWQALFGSIRRFFSERDVREAVTPQLYGATAAQPGLCSFRVAGDPPGFLQTSPEFPMKRLLAAGSGSIYQIAHAFRAGENGPLHRPEFLMLEWYRPAMTLRELQQEIADLLGSLGLELPLARHSFGELFHRYCGLDPWSAETGDLLELSRRHLDFRATLDRGDLLDLLFTSLVAPQLSGDALHCVEYYPLELAENALGIEHAGRPVASRFELFVAGVELANGCEELRDADEFLHRQQDDNAIRRGLGLEPVAPDPALLEAMSSLPACAGAALGLDRLMMVLLGVEDIAQVSPLEQAAAGARL